MMKFGKAIQMIGVLIMLLGVLAFLGTCVYLIV